MPPGGAAHAEVRRRAQHEPGEQQGAQRAEDHDSNWNLDQLLIVPALGCPEAIGDNILDSFQGMCLKSSTSTLVITVTPGQHVWGKGGSSAAFNRQGATMMF